MSRLLHLAIAAQLPAANGADSYAPAGFTMEGFIHCCWPNQLAGVVERYYQGREDLVLLDLDQRAFGSTLIEEDPGSGEKFPHLYRDIPMSAIISRRPLLLDGDGKVDVSFL